MVWAIFYIVAAAAITDGWLGEVGHQEEIETRELLEKQKREKDKVE